MPVEEAFAAHGTATAGMTRKPHPYWRGLRCQGLESAYVSEHRLIPPVVVGLRPTATEDNGSIFVGPVTNGKLHGQDSLGVSGSYIEFDRLVSETERVTILNHHIHIRHLHAEYRVILVDLGPLPIRRR